MKTATHYIDLFVGVIILAAILAALTPTVVTSLTNISQTLSNAGVPLASLLSPAGVIGILLGVGIFYTFYRLFWGAAKGSGSRGKSF